MCVLALVSGVACLCLPGWDHSWGAASPTVGFPQCLSMLALFSSSCKAGLGLDKFVTGRWRCESDGSLFTPLSQGSLAYYGIVSDPFIQSSGVEHLPSTCEALDSLLGTDKKTENHPTKLPPRI